MFEQIVNRISYQVQMSGRYRSKELLKKLNSILVYEDEKKEFYNRVPRMASKMKKSSSTTVSQWTYELCQNYCNIYILCFM